MELLLYSSANGTQALWHSGSGRAVFNDFTIQFGAHSTLPTADHSWPVGFGGIECRPRRPLCACARALDRPE